MADLKKLDEIMIDLEQSTKEMKHLNEVIEEMESLHDIVRWTEEKAKENAEQIERLFPKFDEAIHGYDDQLTHYEVRINEVHANFKKLQDELETATNELKKSNERAFAKHRDVMRDEVDQLNRVFQTKFSEHITEAKTLLDEAKTYQLKKINELSEQLLELEEGLTAKFEGQAKDISTSRATLESGHKQLTHKLTQLHQVIETNTSLMTDKINEWKTTTESRFKKQKNLTLWLGILNIASVIFAVLYFGFIRQ